MVYAAFILVCVALLSGFLALTHFETVRGTRFFAPMRAKMDERTEKAVFVVRHVDWGAFANHLMKTGAARVAHDVAHGILVVVRVAERILTRVVKYLRTRRQEAATVPLERRRFSMKGMLEQMRSAVSAEPQERGEEPKQKQPFDIGG